MTDKCPICNSELLNKPVDNYYSCPRCGNYRTAEDLVEEELPSLLNDGSQKLNKDIRKVAVLSHWVQITYESHLSNKHNKKPFLTKELVENIVKQSSPTPAEQADNFVLWLGDNIKYADHYIEVNRFSTQAIIGSKNESEFIFVFSHLKEEGIIKNKTAVGKGEAVLADATLSFNGWERYKELKRMTTDSRKAFMAMEYGDKTLDIIVSEFRDAVKKTGFELFLLYERPKAGLLDDRLRVEIRTSRFLIADLSHKNPGAYWEAGYAEGLGKPVIYTCDQKIFDNPETKPHFDTNHHLTIKWDETNLKEAAEKLKATIRATLPEAAKLTDD